MSTKNKNLGTSNMHPAVKVNDPQNTIKEFFKLSD